MPGGCSELSIFSISNNNFLMFLCNDGVKGCDVMCAEKRWIRLHHPGRLAEVIKRVNFEFTGGRKFLGIRNGSVQAHTCMSS